MNDPVNHVFYPNLSVPPDIFHGEYNDQSEIPEDRAIRRGRRTAHKEISPLVGDKTLSLKQRIVKNFNRNLAEKTYLKSIDEEAKAKYVLRACVHDVIKADLAKGNRDPVVVRSELENMERIIDENKLQEKLALEKLEEDIYDNNQRAEMKEHVMKQFISGKSNGSIINAELVSPINSMPPDFVPVSGSVNGNLGKFKAEFEKSDSYGENRDNSQSDNSKNDMNKDMETEVENKQNSNELF